MEKRSASSATIGVVLPAGGLGKRLGGVRPKQFLEIGGTPLWVHAVRAFVTRNDIAAVVIAVPGEWLSHFQLELQRLIETDQRYALLSLVEGGAERWLSVRNGIEALPHSVDRVMVHDVARPFVSDAILDSCAARLLAGEGVIVARSCADTVKRVTPDMTISVTLDRREIWLAQTPQCFLRSDLEEWMERAEREEYFLPTDEASLAERYGARVGVVPGESNNDKITLPDDFARFEALWECGALPHR